MRQADVAAATRALLEGEPVSGARLSDGRRLTHIGADGQANMVDVGDKAETDAHGDRRGHS